MKGPSFEHTHTRRVVFNNVKKKKEGEREEIIMKEARVNSNNSK